MNRSGKTFPRERAGARNATEVSGTLRPGLALAVLVVALLAGCAPMPAAGPATTPAPAAGPTAAQAPAAAPTAEQAPGAALSAGPATAPAPTAGPTAAPTAAQGTTAAPTAAPTAAQGPTAGPTAEPAPVAAPTAGPTAAQAPVAAPTVGPTAAQAPVAAPTAAPTAAQAPVAAPTAAALNCPGCPNIDEFCPNKPGSERCYSCMKNLSLVGEKGSCDRVCGDEVFVGSCSLTENAQLKVDYVWTCQYKPLNSGCCQRNGACTERSTQGACTGDGAIWHRDACCSDVTACSGGCCQYTDGTCAGGVTQKACTMAGNPKEWSLGPCPPPPECIPEPATLLLVLSGLGAAGVYLRRRRAR